MRVSQQLYKYFSTDPDTIEAGCDEVARGCVYGPVYAAAVILPKDIELHPWLNDSKKVTRRRRKIVREWIEQTALAWSVQSVNSQRIDEINIHKAALEAMKSALDAVYFQMKFDIALIDGYKSRFPDSPYYCQFVVQGDSKYANIAAASILAKEHHDDYIKNLVSCDPNLDLHYGLGRNMGYGTQLHLKGLLEHGPTKDHRRSFKSVKNLNKTE